LQLEKKLGIEHAQEFKERREEGAAADYLTGNSKLLN
jgi:hypothetical protein